MTQLGSVPPGPAATRRTSASHRASGDALTIVYLWDADYPWDVRTEKICSALCAAGHEVHLVARNKAWSRDVEQLPEGTVHRMPPWRRLGGRLDRLLSFPAFFNPRWRSLLDGVIRDVRADVVIVRDLPLCPLALRVGHRHDIPVVLDMAENYAAMMQEIWDAGRQRWFDVIVRNPKTVAKVERHCLRRLEYVLTVIEESSARIIRNGLDEDRVTVVSNTPPRTRALGAPERAYSSDGPLHVVYLGLMEIPRGVRELLDAVAQLKAQGRSLRLTLIGGGRDEPIFREHADRLGLRGTAEFHGYVPNKNALALVATADVGVVPHHADESWNTTIPNKLFDYMAVGLPVVSSDAVPCARIVSETRAGEVFRSGDAADLACAIDRLFDAETRRRFGTAGRSAVLERYNWEESTGRLLRAMSDVVARGVRS